MSSSVVRISDERIEQLRRIAQVRNSTIAGLIDAMVSASIEAGEIEDRLPGTSITVEGVVVRLAIVEGQPRPIVLTREEARSLAGDLPAKAGTAGLTLLTSGDFVKVQASGRATTIVYDAEARSDRAERILTQSCAGDLARQLRKAAA